MAILDEERAHSQSDQRVYAEAGQQTEQDLLVVVFEIILFEMEAVERNGHLGNKHEHQDSRCVRAVESDGERQYYAQQNPDLHVAQDVD